MVTDCGGRQGSAPLLLQLSGHSHDCESSSPRTNITRTMADHAGHMDHSGHDMTGHAGHVMDHSGHNMMDHSGHNMMDHSAHAGHAMGMDMDNSSCMSSGGMHGMGSMAFHGGYCETVLFSGWEINSVASLIGSMIGIILIAALYEGLKYYREYLFWKAYNSLQYRAMQTDKPATASNEDGRIVAMVGEVIHKQPPRMLCWSHAYQTVLHMIQLVVAYLLMLIFMTYNYWLAAAVMIGGGIGYFLFGWKKSVIVDVTEHCH